jgi:hypothetical protein
MVVPLKGDATMRAKIAGELKRIAVRVLSYALAKVIELPGTRPIRTNHP